MEFFIEIRTFYDSVCLNYYHQLFIHATLVIGKIVFSKYLPCCYVCHLSFCKEGRGAFTRQGRNRRGDRCVAPKFSDALTLFQPGGADSALPLQRSHHKFPRGYVSVLS